MPSGRPLKFLTEEELELTIDKYFNEDLPTKTVIIGQGSNKSTAEIPCPTVTGLAHYLGFESRQSFYDYEKVALFSYTIKRARLLIEQHYEELLQSGLGTGSIFALKNFGWVDKTEQEVSVSINKDLDALEPVDRQKQIMSATAVKVLTEKNDPEGV